MFRIFSDEIERHTQIAQYWVDKLSKEEMAYFMALKSKSQNIMPIENPSPMFQTILGQFNNHPIEKKEEGTITLTDLLWDAIVKKSSEIELVKEPVSHEIPVKHNPVSHPPASIFNSIPDDVSKLVLAHQSGAGSVINFTRSCKKSYSLFSQTDTAQLALWYFNQALDAASVGNWDKVYCLVKVCPDILVCTGTTSYCGQYTYSGLTIYQVGLKNYENGEKYHNKMLEAFDQLPNGKAEMARQYFAVFPDGKMFREEWDIEKAKQLLNKLIETLLRDKKLDRNNLEKMGADLEKAYKNYCDYINATLGTGIEGLMCDPEFFDYIIDKYIEHYDLFTPEECTFYGVKIWDDYVIKLPRNILRATCQGLYYLIDQKEPLNDAGCVLRSGQVVLPLKSDPNFLFGRDFIEMLSGGGRARRVRGGYWPGGVARSGFFQNLCQAKATEHGTIYAAITESVQQHSCPKQ